MTIEEVRDCVQRIRSLADDDEVAHSLEDALHREVLLAISKGAPKELAGEALLTLHIEFHRWHA